MRQQSANSKEKIVLAAGQLFYSRGYNQTSFSDIAEVAGIPRGNFYYYFKTKDDILTAVLDYHRFEVNKLLEACEQHSQEAKDQLFYMIDVLVREEDNIIKYGCPLGTLGSELGKSSLNMQQQVTNIFESLRVWIEKRLADAGLSERSKEISMDILARMQGTTVLANVYHDVEFLRRSALQHKQWLSSILNSH